MTFDEHLHATDDEKFIKFDAKLGYTYFLTCTGTGCVLAAGLIDCICCSQKYNGSKSRNSVQDGNYV